MFDQHGFLAWSSRNGLSDQTYSTIECIRKSEPSRRVGGGGHNVTGRYPSKKMGVTIQFESHRVELPAIYEVEHDADVIEYFDQAPSIKLDYNSSDGKRLGVLHTPNFFMIRQSRRFAAKNGRCTLRGIFHSFGRSWLCFGFGGRLRDDPSFQSGFRFGIRDG